jgi:ParB/RepB/Spo0J family partition protein
VLISIELIDVPPERQRKDLGDINSLANSLASSIGQITPIVVAEAEGRFTLIAGERRLTAAKKLGWPSIDAVFKSDLSDSELVLIELEENIRRKQLEWQEEVAAVAKYAQTLKAPNEAVGKALGLPGQTVSRMITVAEALLVNSDLAKAPSWSSAYQMYQTVVQRKTSAAFEMLRAGETPTAPPPISAVAAALGLPAPPAPVAPPGTTAPPTPFPAAPRPMSAPRPFRAVAQDFLEWAPNYIGMRFNLIHCDFPYGLNMDKAPLQNSGVRWDTIDKRYPDSPELFDKLCRAFFDNQERFIADAAHCIFWLTPRNYGKLASRFAHYGWAVSEFPLIWHKSDNAGIAPDVRRWPRRTYEMAVFASRGDNRIVKVKAASFSGPTANSTGEYHLSEKPAPMLAHFLEMVVDPTTRILDPTCGSGTALRVAKNLGAALGLGFDVQEQHVDYVNKQLEKENAES